MTWFQTHCSVCGTRGPDTEGGKAQDKCRRCKVVRIFVVERKPIAV